MERIRWDDSFTVGIPLLDDQHQQILGLLDDLLARSSLDLSCHAASKPLTRLRVYAERHFEAEERILEHAGYPGLAEHMAEHNAYREKVAQLCLDSMAGKAALQPQALQLLRGWWIDHILLTDAKYTAHLASHAEAPIG